MTSLKTYTLLGADGTPYQSAVKGQLGGHRRSRIYGRLDCPAALHAIARGGYTRHCVQPLQRAQHAGAEPARQGLQDAVRGPRPLVRSELVSARPHAAGLRVTV